MPGQYPKMSPAEAADDALARAVYDALANSPDVDTDEVRVEAAGGTVRLTGAVDTLFEKQMAGALARQVEGVGRVQNDIVVSPTKPVQDKRLREALEQALGEYPEWDPKKVGVREVSDGIAYISGEVTSAQERIRAGWIASRIPGVKQIVNEIEIAPGQPLDDVTIEELVSDAISNDPRIDPFDIEVSVKNGRVTLSGEVEDQEALRAAAQIASAVPGVKGVVNRLAPRSQ